jgi:hypothetical protein
MADEAAPSPVDHVAVLRGMSMRIRAGEPTDPHEVERALEAGFATLITLEAELSRVRAGSGSDPAAVGEFTARIEALREALTSLRTLSVPPGEARIGYGFVLPGSRRNRILARRS